MTQKLILSVAMYSYLCIALLSTCEVVIVFPSFQYMYFFVVFVVLECRPGYFRVFQEMY